MLEDIKYWRGKRVEDLTPDELRAALAEVYRELERLTWLTHQQKLIIESHAKGKKKPGRPPKAKVEEEELADAA